MLNTVGPQKIFKERNKNRSKRHRSAFDVPASFDEFLEIPILVIDHSESVVNGQDGHARGIAFIKHIGQKFRRQQKILR